MELLPLLQLCGSVRPRRCGVYRARRRGQAPRRGEAPDLRHCQRARERRDPCEEGQESVLLDRLRRGLNGTARTQGEGIKREVWLGPSAGGGAIC